MDKATPSNYTYMYVCEHTCSIFATWCMYTVCTAAINSYTGTVQCALLLLLYYKQLLSLLTTVFGTHTYMYMYLHTFVFFVRVSYHNHGV